MTDIDPLLHDAMARVRGPVDARPSLTDVRRRARRHNRRRMTATVGVVACTGVATAALIVRRDSVGPSTGNAATDSTGLTTSTLTPTTYLPSEFSTTTTFPAAGQLTIDASLVWVALSNLATDPTAFGLVNPPADVDRGQMPTAAMFGCESDTCSAMFNYIQWHELARVLGFFDIQAMVGDNPDIDFGQPPREGDVLHTFGVAAPPPTTALDPNNETPTTMSLFDGVLLIDGGAPAGAMEDAYQRLAGYNRTIVPGSGKTTEQTMLMPIGDNASMASGVGQVLGLDGFDTYDNSFLASPIQGMVAVVIGPDYWDRVQRAPSTTSTISTTTIAPTTSNP